ncbi:hypothetical protein DET57_11480 [Klebsiella oxytoca]|uniref:Uncharacterized protein n=1 Tax=Klebsiella oxytoca TaxID=571 RepID=A0A318FH86_KLEOX|nr:hypothetical protein [Klebsiella oxytoca]PXW42088.1 hypothetical protein DET57_11480 [Klebsiella oxytoca]
MQLTGTESKIVQINGAETTIVRDVVLRLGQVAIIGEWPDTMIRAVLYDDGVPYGAYDIPMGPVGEEEILKAVLAQGNLPGFVFE